MLGVERLSGVLGRRLVHDIVPPQVAVVVPGDVNSGAPHHQNMLDGAVVDRHRLVGGFLQRRRLAAAELPVGGDQQLGLSVGDPGPQGRAR